MEWNEIEKLINHEDFDAFESKTRLTTYKISNRTKKTFYYASGKNPLKDTLSYSLTKEAVESFRRFVPSSHGKIGPYYASRVSRNACISPCSLLLALIYVERLAKSNPSYLHSVSSSEIFLISMLVASKFMFDEGTDDEVYNDEWSASSQLDVKQIKSLEANFLKALDWKAFVSPLEFQQMLQTMETRLALKSGLSRGWFSYTEFRCLFQMKQITWNFNNVCIAFIQAFGLFMVVYIGILSACVGCMLIKSNARNEMISYKYHKDIQLSVHQQPQHQLLDNNQTHVNEATFDLEPTLGLEAAFEPEATFGREATFEHETSCPPCTCQNRTTPTHAYNQNNHSAYVYSIYSITTPPSQRETRKYISPLHIDIIGYYDVMVT